jgi:hypothetical protein
VVRITSLPGRRAPVAQRGLRGRHNVGGVIGSARADWPLEELAT